MLLRCRAHAKSPPSSRSASDGGAAVAADTGLGFLRTTLAAPDGEGSVDFAATLPAGSVAGEAAAADSEAALAESGTADLDASTLPPPPQATAAPLHHHSAGEDGEADGLKTGEDAINFFAQHGTTSAVKFVHLKQADTGIDFRPYDLSVVAPSDTQAAPAGSYVERGAAAAAAAASTSAAAGLRYWCCAHHDYPRLPTH